MAASDRRLRIFLTVPAFLSLVKTKARQGLALATALLIAMPGFAQPSQATPLPDSPDSSQTVVVANKTTVAVPAGTRIALVLTHPIQSRYVHRGDDIYAQTTSPVVAGDHVVIPPGTFVQGKVDELERKGRRGELHLQSMQITFPDGYVAPLSGPVTLVSDDGYAISDPGKGRIAGMFAAPAAGLGLGALIGRAAHTTQSSTLGGMTITSFIEWRGHWQHCWPGHRRRSLSGPTHQFPQFLPRRRLTRRDGSAPASVLGTGPGLRRSPAI